jgi:Leucine-rich repeat (LRR) protein
MGNAESKEVDVSGRELEQLPLGEILLQDSTAGDDATVNAVLDRSVVKLFARRNKIQTLPVELAQFTKLVEISLRDNLLSEFPPVLCQLKSLVKLSLSFNRITKVPSGT